MLLYLFVVKGTEHQFFKTYHACHNRLYIRAVFFQKSSFQERKNVIIMNKQLS